MAYAERIQRAWADFVIQRENELETRDPVVASSRGELKYSQLLESQAWHLDLHRQLDKPIIRLLGSAKSCRSR